MPAMKYGAKWMASDILGGGVDIPPELFGGITYYVNNITGSDNNSGTDPNAPLAQINKAIVLSEAARKAAWNDSDGVLLGARYQTRRNRIYVAGTGTYYDAIDYSTNSCDPHHCDIIGVGDNSEANGDGQVQVGSSTTNTVALHTATNTGSGEPGMFGTRWYNMKFLGGGASHYAVEVGKVRGCGFYNCNFSVNANALGGFLADEMFAGTTIEHCSFNYNSSGAPTRCLYISGTGTHTDNRIEDNIFYGATTAFISISGGLTAGTIIARNYFFGVAANGIVDTSTYGCMIGGNYFTTQTGYEVSSTVTTSCAGNYVASGFTAVNT